MRRIAALAAALSLCSAALAGEPPPAWSGVIVRGPAGMHLANPSPDNNPWVEVDANDRARGGGKIFQCVSFRVGGPGATRIFWHFDPSVILPVIELRPGVRIRYAGLNGIADWIEVFGPGPLATEVALEEWMADACGGRAWVALGAEDVAEIEALGASCWCLREAATRRLRGRGAGALRVLVWARRHGDPEVRERATRLLEALGWEP